MSILLKALLNGADFKEALAANGKAIRKVAARKTVRSFKVTRHNGFISTEIYPELSDETEDAPENICITANA
jgi:hypothetical protein